MKKIVIIAMKKSFFINSGVGKYISNYIPFLEKKFDVSILYQPEETGFIGGWIRRIFKLPKILKKEYGRYIKIFTEENFLISVRKTFVDNSIMIVHHYPFRTKVTNFKEQIIRRLSFFTFNTILRKVKNIIAVSDITKKVLEEIGINKKCIVVIPNSVDVSSYKHLNKTDKNDKRGTISKKYHVPKNKIWLLFVGSNESRKNLLTLLKVLSKLSNDYLLVRVGRDGSADELEKMNKIIEENNLSNRYYHLQDLSEDDLISLYQVSDVYLMPSLYEGFGRPIIEAQACGCPVVSTKCGALEEVCGDGALLVSNPLDENEYIKAIEFLLNNKEKFVKNGEKNVDKYTAESNAIKWEKIVDSI